MNSRKGIVLAGGKGTRLYPLTKFISKQLLPIYDKPMIYYSISTLMLSGIRDLLIISTPKDINLYKDLLNNGHQWGVDISYQEQQSPDGLAQAFLISKKFINGHPSALILGDNLFYGENLTNTLQKTSNEIDKTTLFAYPVKDPERYGVVEFNKNFEITNIEEKPSIPKSNFAITGLYFYDKNVVDYAKELKPSKRGELEITDLNNLYLKENNIQIKVLGRGIAWLDTGTFDSLHEAGSFIKSIEHRQGLKVGCPEEIAWRNGWITNNQLIDLASSQKNSSYGVYLSEIIKGKYSYNPK